MNRELTGLFIGAVVTSNIALWINFCILMKAHFDFRKWVLGELEGLIRNLPDNSVEETRITSPLIPGKEWIGRVIDKALEER